MSRTVERIDIGNNGILVESSTNGIKGFYYLTQELNQEEINKVNKIMREYNFFGSRYDINIIRALAKPNREPTENEVNNKDEEQLKCYFDLCNNKYKNEKIPIKMPQLITYDLRNNGENKLSTEELIQRYNKAIETKQIMKGISKTKIKTEILQKFFIVAHSFINSKENKDIKLLNSGKSTYREDLYNPENTRKTNEISKNYINNNEKVSENDKER